MSHNLKSTQVWLVGAGPIAIDYAKVLQHFEMTPTVIGRGKLSASKFEETTGISVQVGGLECFLTKAQPTPDTFIIIATGTEALMPTLLKFMKLDFKRILIEKPAAVSIEELLNNEINIKPIQEKVFVAFNRRFYPSVIKAMEIIKEDEGLQSMHFEFTEWSHRIEPLEKAPGVKENWFFANSTHVIDLAFFIAGQPVDWRAFSKEGTLSWHDKSYFSGAGITDKGVVFSYHSNWESAGRWGIELLTKKRRIYLKPLEEVSLQLRGNLAVEPFNFGVQRDDKFKPGFLEQLQAFLNFDSKYLLSIENHLLQSKNVFNTVVNNGSFRN